MRAASHWWTSLFLPCRLKHQNNLFNETEDVLYTLFHTAHLIYSILLMTSESLNGLIILFFFLLPIDLNL